MPRRPKKPCAYPGCPRLTENRYCEEHQKQENKRYERYYRQPETKRRYGTKWKRIRKQYAQSHPFCEQCFDNGIYVPVEEVHHIKPLSEGGTHDAENLISLCRKVVRTMQRTSSPCASHVMQGFTHSVATVGTETGGETLRRKISFVVATEHIPCRSRK